MSAPYRSLLSMRRSFFVYLSQIPVFMYVNINSMNMANAKRIIGIETTFGALREIKVGGSILKCGDNVRFEKFHGEKE